MNKKNNYNDPDAIAGVISKSAFVKSLEKTESEMSLINTFTQEKLDINDVYIFKALIADNEQDDRNFMPFNAKSIEDMAELYVGKTVMKDHRSVTDNQIARVYDTEIVVDETKTTELGEPHTELYAKIYMLDNESNKDFISAIKGGIKKEVSTSSKPEKLICSECGTDQFVGYCKHYPGVVYKKDTPCKMLIDGVKECYELSFVAIPAQPRAGVSKSVGFTKIFEEIESDETNKTNADIDFRIKSAKNIIEMERLNDEQENA